MRLRPGLVALAGAITLAFAAPAHADGPAAVTVKACQTGDQPADRSATFEGRMNTVKGAVRMAQRFKLLSISGSPAQAQEVKMPKLSAWHSSDRGVKRFVYAQKVTGLAEGATYRTVVNYRWLDANGKVIRRAQRESTDCIQDGDLPNLVLAAVQVTPGSNANTASYTLSVVNTGKGDAGPFDVGLIVDGALPDSRGVDGLKAGSSTTVKITGPLCNRLRAVVDRSHALAETIEDDNELRSRC
jgi:CARDB protein